MVMQPQSLYRATMMIGLGLALLSGCGQKNTTGRYEVAGVVTFQGKPLDQGTIEFAPEGGGGAAGGAMIKDGGFTVPETHGLRPGLYQVKIYSSDAATTGAAPAFPGESRTVAKERIPAAYNSKSKLTAKVTEEGPNQFNFDIP